MESNTLLGLASIVILGIGAQWISWRIRIPAILPLLICGFIAGPITGFLDPDKLFGDLLFPAVSLSVGIILFEGGLSLRLDELRQIGTAVSNLILVGTGVTWAATTVAAKLLLDLPWELCLLLGAVLVVTGPTVIIPLLRQVRPSGQVGSILRWEGILIDPIGATLALLVFESILIGDTGQATFGAIAAILSTIFLGGLTGLVGAFLLTTLLRRYWIPDYLQNPVTIMLVVAVFACANLMQDESGLLAVTVMGIYMANQKSVSVQHIVEFKESISILLISVLFIVLAAKLSPEDIRQLPVGAYLFVGALILIVRPLSVAISTWRADLTWQEKGVLAWMAPRGIVAAAVSSIFALRLAEEGRPDAEIIAPITFLVIAATVTVYGLTSKPLTRRLGVAQPNPKGVLFLGAHRWARALASELKKLDIPVIMADTNWALVSAARLEGMRTYFGNALSDHAAEELDLSGIGRMLALTPNEGINSLACVHFIEDFGRAEVYQLPAQHDRSSDRNVVADHLRGRQLFGADMTYDHISELAGNGAQFKATRITEAFTFDQYREHYGDSAIPLVVIVSGVPKPVTTTESPKIGDGDVLISLLTAPEMTDLEIAAEAR